MNEINERGALIDAITIFPKRELTASQLELMNQILGERLPQDIGAWGTWAEVGAQELLYVPFLRDEVIGILHAGGSARHIVPAWWMRPKFREKKLGKPMAIAFARYLKARGVTGTGHVLIDGPDWERSQALLRAFQDEFNASESRSN